MLDFVIIFTLFSVAIGVLLNYSLILVYLYDSQPSSGRCCTRPLRSSGKCSRLNDLNIIVGIVFILSENVVSDELMEVGLTL